MAKTTCPITRQQFRDAAKPVSITINGVPQLADVKEFSTGSLGWYLNGKRVARSTQMADTSFPTKPLVPAWVPRIPGGPPIMNLPSLQIDAPALRIYPVLSAGVSAAGPQTPLGADAKLGTPMDKHPNTAAGIGQFLV